MYYKGCIKIMYSEGGFYSLLGTEIRTTYWVHIPGL